MMFDILIHNLQMKLFKSLPFLHTMAKHNLASVNFHSQIILFLLQSLIESALLETESIYYALSK